MIATSEQNYPEREIRNIDQFVFGEVLQLIIIICLKFGNSAVHVNKWHRKKEKVQVKFLEQILKYPLKLKGTNPV